MHIVGKNCCLNKTNYKSPLQKCEMNVEKQKKKKLLYAHLMRQSSRFMQICYVYK